MKNFKEYLCILILFLLQTTLLAEHKIFGIIIPNAVLVFAVCFSATNPIAPSAVVAVISGLMLDWMSGRVGVSALILLYISILCSYVSKKFFYKRLIYIMLLTFAADILFNTSFLVLNFYIWGVFVNVSGIACVFLQALIDSLLSVICYFAYVKRKNKQNTELSFKKEVIF